MASSPLKLWSYLKPSYIAVTYSWFLWGFPSPAARKVTNLDIGYILDWKI